MLQAGRVLYTPAVNDERYTAADVVLASGSPRRASLLRMITPILRTAIPGTDESPMHGESPWQLSRRLAWEKLYSQHLPGEVILTADTVVDLDGTPLGKPEDDESAARMLRRLRGRTHLVNTSVAVSNGLRSVLLTVTSAVTLRRYSDAEMWRYVRSGAAEDKAGAYAVQDGVFRPVRCVKGSVTNVAGLPLAQVYGTLRALGVPVTPPPAKIEFDVMGSSRYV